MASFTDQQGREWQINIDAPTVMEIRSDCDPEFLKNDTKESNTYIRLQEDPVLLCRVVFLLTREQREARHIAEPDFYRSVIGEAIDRATEAMLDAIANFIPKSTKDLLVASAEMRKRVLERGTAELLTRLKDPQLEAKVMENMNAKLDEVIAELTQP